MDAKSITPDAVVSVLGKPCPMPALFAVRAMRKLENGRVLEIVGDNSFFKRIAPTLTRRTGNKLLGQVKHNSREYSYFLQKG